jgi:N-acetylglutamate synthase-like GNAT family acetyltransferase
MTLSALFREARQYGRVRVCTMDDGKYFSYIEFNTIEHTKLEAKSRYDCLTPEEAVGKAIESAKAIVNSIRNLPVTALLEKGNTK